MAENEYTAKKVILKNNQGEYLIPYVEFPIATETSAGIVQPDNSTISVNNGTIIVEGIKTKNAVLKYDWIGTKAEWEEGRANGTILDSWVCYITDDFVQTDTSGTRNYNELENKPTIGGIELKGNKELGELGIQSKLTAGENITISEEGVISSVGSSSSELPTDVYTKTNLVAGEGIKFEEETTGSDGIDENTLALWHFDDSLVDIVRGIEVTKTRGLTTGGKFGGCIQDQEGEAKLNINNISVLGLTGADTFAYDFWYKRTGTASSGIGYYGLGSLTSASTGLQLSVSATGVLQLRGSAYKVYTDSGNSANIYETVLDVWTHILVQYIGADKRALVFVDGNKVFDYTGTALSNTFSVAGMIFNRSSSTSGCPALIDEFRITSGIVATENFSVPTEPYGNSETTEKIKISSTITKLSQLENDSGFITEGEIPDTSTCLQTTGGTMTGNILLSSGAAIRAVGSSNFTQLAGAEAIKNGAMINLFGKDYKNNPGEFAIYARNGSDSKILLGKPDGTLTWNGEKVVTEEALSDKQDKLTAGNGITIENNVISSTTTGGGSTFEMDYDETTKTLIFSNGDL